MGPSETSKPQLSGTATRLGRMASKHGFWPHRLLAVPTQGGHLCIQVASGCAKPEARVS